MEQQLSSACKCGGNKFAAHQVSHHDIIADGNGNFLDDRGIYHSDTPFGSFTCTICGAEYEELSDIAKESSDDYP